MSFHTKCPKCKSDEIIEEKNGEYTGGGYADYWFEYECVKCGYTWRSDVKTDYF